MFRLLILIVVSVLLNGCGHKGALVLPAETSRQPAQPPTHDVPPVEERRR